MHVAVYGNLIQDIIYTIPHSLKEGETNIVVKNEKKVGGIANFARAVAQSRYGRLYELTAVSAVGNDEAGRNAIGEINRYCDHTNIYLDTEHSTSSALVVADSKSSRTAFTEWGACSFHKWKSVKADWHHLMYIDRMNLKPEDMSQFGGIISADLCDVQTLNSDRVKAILPYINWLIVSDSPCFYKDTTIKNVQSRHPVSNVNIFHHCPVISGVCIHGRTDVSGHWPDTSIGTYLYPKDGPKNNTDYHVACFPKSQVPLQVTGAGDYFAAHMIAAISKSESAENLVWAHDGTLDLLQRQS